jgi:hypothetical protein
LYPVWGTEQTVQTAAADAEPLRHRPDRARLRGGSPSVLSIEQQARAADRVAGPRAVPLARFSVR